jgi:hypothetical protein
MLEVSEHILINFNNSSDLYKKLLLAKGKSYVKI